MCSSEHYNLWLFFIIFRNAVPGFALTLNARSFVARNATVVGVTSHAGRSLDVATRALVFAENLARSCAEFAIKMKLPSCTLELSKTKMQDSLSCQTVNTWLKLQQWITGWTRIVDVTILN